MSSTDSSPITWITGGSSGIGRELAIALAKEGKRVAISARSEDKLNEVAGEHPNIFGYPLDVTDAEATAATVARIESEIGPIDIAILNAGVWHPMGSRKYNLELATKSMVINYIGVINGLAPVMKSMTARGTGHIMLMSSVAGYRGLPGAAAYGPSKAAVISLGETLYNDLMDRGVKLQVINPGFVKTPMTDVNEFPMPFIVPVEEAVERILHGMKKNKFEICFPRRLAFLLKLLRIIRYKQYFRMSRWWLQPPEPQPDAKQ